MLSRFACSRRAASLRLGQNQPPPCGGWAFTLASFHPRCSRRLRASYSTIARMSFWRTMVYSSPPIPTELRFAGAPWGFYMRLPEMNSVSLRHLRAAPSYDGAPGGRLPMCSPESYSTIARISFWRTMVYSSPPIPTKLRFAGAPWGFYMRLPEMNSVSLRRLRAAPSHDGAPGGRLPTCSPESYSTIARMSF